MADFEAVYAARQSFDDPLSGLKLGRIEPPKVPDGWARVAVRASSLNHHDLWSLRGVGLPAERLPMILGTDAAGVDEAGNEVVVHSVVGSGAVVGNGAVVGSAGGDPLFAPDRSLLSERHPGTMASWVSVPRENLLPKPPGLSFVEAACLPTAWLTAHRMLLTKGRLAKGGGVLVQGAGGGVATAAVVLALALGARVYATSRSGSKRERVSDLGAIALEPGARLPERVDVVIETVGEATMEHSLKSLAPGGRLVVSGATSGHLPTVNLRRVFHYEQEVLGSLMGTREEFAALLELLVRWDIRPIIDEIYDFGEARRAFARLASGEVFGKVVLRHD